MKSLLYLIIIIATAITGCEKELSQEGPTALPEPKPDTDPVEAAPTFQLKAFYSDIPIDFDESDDVIKSETDLWAYVLDYVKDDYHILRSDSTVEVVQNAITKPGLNDQILFKEYYRGTDNVGEYIVYLTPDYNQAKYRLHEMTETHFIIGLKWKDGARVFSRFERIN